jgi:hypothetical protein
MLIPLIVTLCNNAVPPKFFKADHSRNVRFTLPAQPINAAQALNLSAADCKLQGLTGTFVELTRHFVQVGLRVHRQVGSFWKVLSQQTIGVLVRPALSKAAQFSRLMRLA